MTTAATELRILVLSASTRTGSLNTSLAELASRRIQAAGSKVTRVSLADFPVPSYDGDLQEAEGIPEAARRLGELLGAHDGFVIATPEYNYSMPGNLKNLIDWVSRIKPWPFTGANGLLMSASTSLVGGHRGLIALRVPLEGLGSRLYPTMFSLALAHQAFDADGELVDSGLAQRLTDTVTGFLNDVEATVHYRRVRDLLGAA